MIISLTFHSFFSLSFSFLIDRIIPNHHFGLLFVLLWCLLGGYVIHLAGQWLRERWLSKIAVSAQPEGAAPHHHHQRRRSGGAGH
jgi:hypothetical protein